MQEIPLLIFTVLEQVLVGALLTLTVMRFMGKLDSDAGFKSGIVLVIVTIVAVGASLFHLGQPLRAVNVVFGLGSSWLSREILFMGVFGIALVAYVIAERLKYDMAAKVFAAIGSVAGIFAVVATSICYMQPGVPAWDSFLTPLQFMLTLVLAGIPFGLALSYTWDQKKSRNFGICWSVFVVLLCTQFAMRWVFFSDIVTLTSLLPLV